MRDNPPAENVEYVAPNGTVMSLDVERGPRGWLVWLRDKNGQRSLQVNVPPSPSRAEVIRDAKELLTRGYSAPHDRSIKLFVIADRDAGYVPIKRHPLDGYHPCPACGDAAIGRDESGFADLCNNCKAENGSGNEIPNPRPSHSAATRPSRRTQMQDEAELNAQHAAESAAERLKRERLENVSKMRTLIENPASWVTKAVAAHYEELEDKVRPEWLPKLEHVRAGYRGKAVAGEMNEFGCGAYGCVYETLTPGIVMKVTTDSTEAEFAARLAPELKAKITVEYHTVASLPAEHDKRQIYLLWREEAQKVGAIAKESYGHRAREAIHAQHQAAESAYGAMHAGAGEVVIAGELAAWARFCGMMSDVPELRFLATGMLEVYKRQQIFFGDIHEGNLGLCSRGGVPTWVITDPGHVAVVDL